MPEGNFSHHPGNKSDVIITKQYNIQTMYGKLRRVAGTKYLFKFTSSNGEPLSEF